MDAKQVIHDYLRSHPGERFSPEGLARDVNDHIQDKLEWDISVHTEEVLTHCLKLAKEQERIQHHTRELVQTVTIDGEKRTLLDVDEILRFDIVADLAPDRLDEIENLHGDELRQWIIEELADETESGGIEHEFVFEDDGWG